MHEHAFKYALAFSGLVVISPGFAETVPEMTDNILLPDMVIEGEIIRPGTVGVNPGLGGINDAATLMRRVPGANGHNNGPLSGIAQDRGLFGDRVNVISDGTNYKPACANAMDAPLSHVPASLTETLNEVPTAGYAFFNLRAQYRPQSNALKGLQIGAGIENIFNKAYRTHLSGLNRSPVNEGTPIGEHLPGPGRNFYVTLSYDL